MRLLPRLASTALLCLFAVSAQAARVVDVQVRGLADEAMVTNVRTSLQVVDAMGKELSGRRLAYLVREAEDEAREALEPFGYYNPVIKVERTRDDSEKVVVTVDIALGEPVRTRIVDLDIQGEGADDRYLLDDLLAFRPQTGDVFDHQVYEASKVRITRRFAERGYFDADFLQRRVEVTRAENAADIVLHWQSGPRFDMGRLEFVQTPKTIVDEDLLRRLVYWEDNSYFHQGRLDRFRESLAKLDYFASIDIAPRPEDAQGDVVPVTVTLVPAKRNVRTYGLSYGTESGAGVRLGLERRYVNRRGHKALLDIDYAQKRKSAVLQYRIPAFAWLDGWYTASAQLYDEQTDYIDTRRIELVGSRSGQITRDWTATASVHALRERWAYVDEDDGDPNTPVEYRTATFTYPSIRTQYVRVDDPLFPRDGFSASAMLRAGVEGAGSDANFAQAHVSGRWFRGFGERNRVIARAEIGRTFTDSLTDVPPSLRFFAGGDRSVRGYAFREVGPRRTGSDGKRYAIGAKNVVTGSVEYERYLNDQWGGAVFVDSGSAYDGSPDFKTGVGIGARWRSPVGLLRVDVARGLDEPDNGFEIYLNIGADF